MMPSASLSLPQARQMVMGLHARQIISESGQAQWLGPMLKRYQRGMLLDRATMLHGLGYAFSAAELYRQGIMGPGSPDGKAYAARQETIEKDPNLSQAEKELRIQRLREQQLAEQQQAEGYLLEAAIPKEEPWPIPNRGWVVYPPLSAIELSAAQAIHPSCSALGKHRQRLLQALRAVDLISELVYQAAEKKLSNQELAVEFDVLKFCAKQMEEK